MTNFGERVKARREQLGITQQELAEAVGYTHKSSINKIERGQIRGSVEQIAAFAKALKTSRAYLAGDIDDPERKVIYDGNGNFVQLHTPEEYEMRQRELVQRLGAYIDLFERLRHLKKDDREKAAKMIDGILSTFEE